MGANPLDWTAVPFLTLYVALAALVFAAGFFLRSAIGPARGRRHTLNELEWAYLAGGPSRVGDVALLCLMARGGGRINAKRTPSPWTDPAPLRRCRARGSPCGSRRACRARRSSPRFRPLSSGFGSGCRPSATRRRTLRCRRSGSRPCRLSACCWRSARPRPSSARSAITPSAFCCSARSSPRPRLCARYASLRTRAGEAALDAHRNANARSARAPLTGELMLAVALSGAVVLSGTEFAPIYAASRARRRGRGLRRRRAAEAAAGAAAAAAVSARRCWQSLQRYGKLAGGALR